jgi:hypothetical protein
MSLLKNNNRDLKRDRIWVWSLPAWITTMPDGSHFNTCPSAGVCAKACYARKGTFRFSNVLAAHTKNLTMVLDDMDAWEQTMRTELEHKRMDGAWVRIHDGGDFFSDEYLEAWLRIARATPKSTFYCYTKEVVRFRNIVEPDCPPNFKYVYSYGGKHDHLISDDDRQCDVFPDEDSLVEAGFVNQAASDLLAITGDMKVGIVVNNHVGAVKAMKGLSMKQQQEALRKRD